MYEANQKSASYQGNGGPSLVGATINSTLAARLERAANVLNSQCVRIEDTLSKVNGTPRQASQGERPEKIAPTAPLAQSVEQVEQLAKRLSELASNMEGIA